LNNPEGQERCQVKDQNEGFIDTQKLVNLGAERLSCRIEELVVNSVYGIGGQKIVRLLRKRQLKLIMQHHFRKLLSCRISILIPIAEDLI
jgi:hypothetical protein